MSKFTSKSLEEVAVGLLFAELRAFYPDLQIADVRQRAKYAVRSFLDTEMRNRRIYTEGKTAAYPLVYHKTRTAP